MQVCAILRVLTPGSTAPFCATAVALLLVGLAWAPVAHAADPVRAVEVDAESVRSNVQVVDMDLNNAIAKERSYPLERRYLEAQIAHDRGNLATASVQLVDLVNDPEFQLNRDYGDALFLLGDCLFRIHNYVGAKRYLDQVLRLPDQKNFQIALQELADISVRQHHMGELEHYARRLDVIPPGERKTELLYQFGRSFFSAQAWHRADGLLKQVNVGEKRWPTSRFYIGAILVAQGKPDLAVAEFQNVLDAAKGQEASRRPEQEVVDYAHIALGRLFLRQKRYNDAAANYRGVDRNSSVYAEALLELAATYVAGNEPKSAIDTLDLLLLTVSDDGVAVQAAALRGRIHMLTKQVDQADAAYQNVVDRYSAIAGELTRFASSDKDLEQFFAWLLNRASDEFQVVRPVSERVAKYIEHDDDMRRVVSLFDDMAAERADVKECGKLAATIEAALKESSRLVMVPEFKDAWLRVVENQNRTMEIGRHIAELLRSFAEPNMNGEEREKAKSLREQGRKWVQAFAKGPATKDEYLERAAGVSAQIGDLAAQVGMLNPDLEQARQQVLAVEMMLNERMFGPDTSVVLPEEKEAEIRRAMQAEKDELRRSYRAIEELNHDVEVASQGVGEGDKVSDDEAAVRERIAAVQQAEMDLHVAALARAGSHVDETGRLQSVRKTIDLLSTQMRGILETISTRAGERVAGVQQVLTDEQHNIAEYRQTVLACGDDARRMTRDVGYSLIRSAGKRLAEILLEADLGLVDVAWQRKQTTLHRLNQLQDERSSRVNSLGEVLHNLTPPSGAEER